jgi:hypothetical protein
MKYRVARFKAGADAALMPADPVKRSPSKARRVPESAVAPEHTVMSRQEIEARLLGQLLRHPDLGFGIVVAIEPGEVVINAGMPPARRRVLLTALGEWELCPVPSGIAPNAPAAEVSSAEPAADDR